MVTRQFSVLAAILSMAFAGAAHSAVSSNEAKELDGPVLTAFGAEKAGNKEGTIPPYSGKAPKAPASYDLKDPGQRPDPYGEKPLFSITAQNAQRYADKLDGMIDVFKAYPDFRMDVYPTHRDVVYPQYVLDNTVKNATSCKGDSDELKLEGCYGGLPFPIPKTGKQVMWNHLLNYYGHAIGGNVAQWLTPPDGKAVLQSEVYLIQQSDYYDPKNKEPNPTDGLYYKFLATDTGPARRVGGKFLSRSSLDMVGGQRTYQYLPGQRRVKLSPNMAYDTPHPYTGGASIMDEGRGFLGALDRYDFKLIGKKEKYIMYNNFDLTNHKACSPEKITNNKNFPHPDCVRWELHRVWVVEGTLKPNFRHIYAKRYFYWDEDAPGAGLAENYDAAGALYRISSVVMRPYYDHEEGKGADLSPAVFLDLRTGIWATLGLTPGKGMGNMHMPPQDDRVYTPEALSGGGIR